jgi:hypothetical protein
MQGREFGDAARQLDVGHLGLALVRSLSSTSLGEVALFPGGVRGSHGAGPGGAHAAARCRREHSAHGPSKHAGKRRHGGRGAPDHARGDREAASGHRGVDLRTPFAAFGAVGCNEPHLGRRQTEHGPGIAAMLLVGLTGVMDVGLRYAWGRNLVRRTTGWCRGRAGRRHTMSVFRTARKRGDDSIDPLDRGG